jgi:2-oxoisovalerate dehydrogenase E1 component beta subunit
LISAIRDDDPVLFLEPKRIYRAIREEVPEGDYTVPLGKARIAKEGNDVSLFAYGAMLQEALAAAAEAEKKDISVEVIDLRTLLPFDKQAVLESVVKTARAVIVHEAPKLCGFGAELAATLAEEAIEHLKAPIVRVTGFDTPFPYTLENQYLPDVTRIVDGIVRVMNY